MSRLVSLAGALLLAGAGAVETGRAAGPASDRQAELLHLLRHDCGSCHGLTLKGGLGPALQPAALAETPDDILVETILHGRPGTPMPPWGFALSREEAAWLVDILRKGVSDGR